MGGVIDVANGFIGLGFRHFESLRILSKREYNFEKGIDCIGLVIGVFREFGVCYFEKFISSDLYRGGVKKSEIDEILASFLVLNKGKIVVSNEILSGNILVFFINQEKLHFGISEVIDGIVYIIHANSDVKKVTKEILSNNLKKDLINILKLDTT